MKKLQFIYDMQLAFSEDVNNHIYTLKCIPQNNDMQIINESSLIVVPNEKYEMDVDSFGNKIIYGSLKKKHHIFHVLLKGEATIGLSFANKEKDLNKITIYKYQSKYTKPGENLKEFFEKNYVEKENNYKTAVDLMHKLYKEFIYEKDVTNIKTTAEEAMALKRGVCQDYSHIMLSLLRMRKIPSRYVVGMLYGEGFSHAWIEVFSDGYWYGLDPTNNIVVSDNHLKISHGRDYHDCIVNKGILNGGGKQTQTIQVILEEKND